MNVRRSAAAAVAAASVVAGTGAAAFAATATVTVTNAGYSPKSVTVSYGSKVTWKFQQGSHSVTDSSRLKLYDSGSTAPGGTFSQVFTDAGSYPYHSTVGTAITGTVLVPATAKPASGSRTTYFTIGWGSGDTPDGYGEQVQLKEPGAKAWTSFVYGTVVKNATMRPADWGNRTGTYSFRAKLYKGSTPAASSGWSPIATISVH